MKSYTLAVFYFLLSSMAQASSKIIISTNDVEALFQGYTIEAPFKKMSSVRLELGEDLSLKTFKIISDNQQTYRATIQLETSMTVMDEGPHFDLVDWKHCTTAWLSIERINKNTFKTPELEQINTDCFPKVSRKEIVAAVLEHGGERWSNLLKDSLPRNELPIGFSLSSVKVKIERQVDKKWIEVTTIDFLIPMGC